MCTLVKPREAACEPAGTTLCVCVRVQHIEVFALRVARFVCVSMNLAFLFTLFCVLLLLLRSSRLQQKFDSYTRTRIVWNIC